MLTRDNIRECHGALDLLRSLGYPVVPIAVDPEVWRRGGIELTWNGEATLSIASRLEHFDIFLLDGAVPDDAVTRFLRSYQTWNLLTKSVLITQDEKRLSFCYGDHRLTVDLDAPSAHAIDRLNLLAFTGEASLPRVFERALDRESVTRQFFERFRTAVRDVAEALGDEAEALLILSRLLFLQFIQEKGWLNGERRFLVDRLAACIREGREFFADVLLPLFFGCLNTANEERDAGARRLGRIPYLNGGLFEPSAYERKHADLHLPNDLMQRVLEDVFEKFDFRIDERDAAGTHVDPEMLGKVFESLMAAGERAASGSFYTPKEIVDVLTARAIGEWLGGGDPREKLGRLETITILDPACGSGAFLLSALGVIERTYRELAQRAGEDVPSNLRQRIVERSLFGVDVKPEAVRLCELRLWLAIVSGSDAAIDRIQPLPNLDRNVMQGNSLLSPTDFLGDGRASTYHAWRYALRAQADLLERYRTSPQCDRPALARMIRANDLRLASDLVAAAIDADEAELQRLVTPQRDLFGRALPIDNVRCKELQQRIVRSRRALAKIEDGTLDFFSFDVHFAPVMARGGFDVVAGNPPWVRNSRIDAKAKRMYTDRYALFRPDAGGAAFHQPDLSVIFFERALAMAAPGGVVSMLLPAKIANAAYAAPLRRFVEEHCAIVALDDWSDHDRRPFDADTFPLGITVRHVCDRHSCLSNAARDRQECLSHTRISAGGETFTIAQRNLAVPTSEWALVPDDVSAILARLRERHEPLQTVLHRRPIMGVKTGDNRAFFLRIEKISCGRAITEEGIAIPLSALCRCVRGRELKRWTVGRPEWMLWPPAGGWRKRPRWLEQLAAVRGVDPAVLKLAYVRPEHVGIKVAWKDVSRGMAAAVLPDTAQIGAVSLPLIPNQTLYSLDAVSVDEAFALAALLNSTVADALLLCVAERAKDAHYRYFGRTVGRIPLPRFTDDALLLERLVRASRKAHMGEVDEELDEIAATLFGVSAAELEVLRRFVAKRLGR